MPENSLAQIARSVVLFVVASLYEVGGGWLMWKWLRMQWTICWALLAALILVMYGVVPTLHQALFARVDAEYGGFIIFLSHIWGSVFDGDRPDRRGVVGASIASSGVVLMMYTPR